VLAVPVALHKEQVEERRVAHALVRHPAEQVQQLRGWQLQREHLQAGAGHVLREHRARLLQLFAAWQHCAHEGDALACVHASQTALGGKGGQHVRKQQLVAQVAPAAVQRLQLCKLSGGDHGRNHAVELQHARRASRVQREEDTRSSVARVHLDRLHGAGVRYVHGQVQQLQVVSAAGAERAGAV